MYKIHLLPASFGDSILVEYGNASRSRYILIDGGPYNNFEKMISGLKRVAPKLKELELLVITHIDIDHIDGIITLLNQAKPPFRIKDIWFNGFKQLTKIKSDVLGGLQGEYLTKLIKKNKLPHNKAFKGGAVYVKDSRKPPVISLLDNFTITLLGPSAEALEKLKPVWKKEIDGILTKESIEERWTRDTRYRKVIDNILGEPSMKELQEATPKGDKSAANLSSIAFIGEFEGKKCLFAGDAPSDELVKTIDPIRMKNNAKQIKLNAWKLAHHGSKGSTLDKLMKKIQCKKIMVSTDGSRYQHPDPECIAKCILHNGPGVSFYFNYASEYNEKWADAELQSKHKFKSVYPKSGTGLSISL